MSDISPGIVDIVNQLNKLGYATCDSGDGSNYENGMECAFPVRNVSGYVPDNMTMQACADSLQELFPKGRVEVSYSPGEPALFIVFPDGYQNDNVS
jgi:hypothetical protein